MPEIFTILLGVAALAALVVFAWLLARSFRKPSPIKIALTAATARTPAPAEPDLPRVLLDPEEDDDFDPTKVNFALGSNAAGAPVKLLHDQDADEDIPTQPHALFVVAATAHSDRGLRRKRNEDSVLLLEKHGLFAVADGMGGYSGGGVASQLAVSSLEETFCSGEFGPSRSTDLPRRAAELASAIARANGVVHAKASGEGSLKGMGTTLCAARFCADKERLYIAHVGDSRAYRFRAGHFERMTTDHTFGALGATGPTAKLLSRAVGVSPTVPVDVILGKPEAGDLYLLCSDGLNKMLPDAEIAEVLARADSPTHLARHLVDLANERGGNDNVTVIVMHVQRSPAA